MQTKILFIPAKEHSLGSDCLFEQTEREQISAVAWILQNRESEETKSESHHPSKFITFPVNSKLASLHFTMVNGWQHTDTGAGKVKQERGSP